MSRWVRTPFTESSSCMLSRFSLVESALTADRDCVAEQSRQQASPIVGRRPRVVDWLISLAELLSRLAHRFVVELRPNQSLLGEMRAEGLRRDRCYCEAGVGDLAVDVESQPSRKADDRNFHGVAPADLQVRLASRLGERFERDGRHELVWLPGG